VVTIAQLSRRAFLASTAALAALWGLPREMLGSVLASPLVPSDAITTLRQTIGWNRPSNRQYRTLRTAPGEDYIPRLDVLGREPSASRAQSRRSLGYFGHFTDIHLIDAQSPARIEPMQMQSHALWDGAFRPQDTLTVHVLAAMVSAVAGARFSPVTGAPMTAAMVTGDTADMKSSLELRWYINTLDGGSIVANSGAPGVYEGVQAWSESVFAYHPDDPTGDPFGEYGFPTLPGMLQAAVTVPAESPGVPVPWYSVYGNHDTLYMGTLPINQQLVTWSEGGRKAATIEGLLPDYLAQFNADASVLQRMLGSVAMGVGMRLGIKAVTPDPQRKIFDQVGFMQAHLDSPAVPGPVGHGFTQANVDSQRTWWKADLGPFVRAFGLDTCNQVAGPDGAVPEEQFLWLRGELEQAARDNKLAVVLSHHNSLTLENTAAPALGPSQRLVHAEEFIAMLLDHPNLIAWVNGHTHANTIQAHSRDGRGFWEITAASCVDFPQQQQLIEVVDNRDGTLSLFTTVVDHAGPAEYRVGDYSALGLASLSRELSANDWEESPTMLYGSPLDRNCELLLPAPFDLSTITDAAVEAAQAEQRARIVAYETGLRP